VPSQAGPSRISACSASRRAWVGEHALPASNRCLGWCARGHNRRSSTRRAHQARRAGRRQPATDRPETRCNPVASPARHRSDHRAQLAPPRASQEITRRRDETGPGQDQFALVRSAHVAPCPCHRTSCHHDARPASCSAAATISAASGAAVDQHRDAPVRRFRPAMRRSIGGWPGGARRRTIDRRDEQSAS